MNAVGCRGTFLQEHPEPVTRSGNEQRQPQYGECALCFHTGVLTKVSGWRHATLLMEKLGDAGLANMLTV